MQGRSRVRRVAFPGSILLVGLLQLLAGAISSAQPPSREGSVAALTVETVERKIDALTHRVDAELKAATMRFEAVSQSTERSLSFFFWFAAIGSALGGFYVVFRNHQMTRDHQRERAFYEERIRGLEHREGERGTREASLVAQQLRIGEQAFSASDQMLARQIDGISKLGGVIDLLQKTFQLQLTREEEQETVL